MPQATEEIWFDVREAEPALVREGYRQAYEKCRTEVRQLKNDVESWNENYRPAGVDPIEFDWDFSSMQDDEG